MKQQIKELRVRIDGYSQLVKGLKPVVDIVPNVKGYFLGETRNESIDNLFHQEFFPSQELKDCHKSILYAKAWLGKCLKELGEDTPYKNDGKRKSVEDIEPADDRNIQISNGGTLIKGKKGTCEEGNSGVAFVLNDSNFEFYRDKNHIEKVDWLRQEIQGVIDEVRNIGRTQEGSFTKEFNIARTNAYTYLCEARFALGFELERIREESNG